jgi:hypothetical protein
MWPGIGAKKVQETSNSDFALTQPALLLSKMLVLILTSAFLA